MPALPLVSCPSGADLAQMLACCLIKHKGRARAHEDGGGAIAGLSACLQMHSAE